MKCMGLISERVLVKEVIMFRGAVFLSLMIGLVISMFMEKAEVEGTQRTLNSINKTLDPNAKSITSLQDAEKQIEKSMQKIMNKRYENLGH